MRLLPVTAAAVLAVVGVGATVVGARATLTALAIANQQAPEVAGELAAPIGDAGTTPRPVGRPYRIMVVGDSVGISLQKPIVDHADDLGVDVFSRAAPGCSYDSERTSSGGGFTEDQTCVDIVNIWRADVQYFKPDLVLFMYGSWSNWEYQGEVRTQCDDVMAAHVTDLYSQAAIDLGSMGAPVYFVGPANWRAAGFDEGLDRAYNCLRDVMQAFVLSHPNTAYINIQSLACNADSCDATAGGHALRDDGLHYSGAGATTVAIDILKHSIETPAAGWPDVVPISCC